MLTKRIPNATRYLGAPADWTPDDGPCGSLAIQDIATTAGPAMMSLWEPTPDELARLLAGAPIRLVVCGVLHPPVEISVGEIPEL